MYSNDLFWYFEAKGWEKIAGGAYGQVYSDRNGKWVIKNAMNDGTRTYLEWCLHRTNIGMKMKGMPEIDFLVPLGEVRYLVAMRHYSTMVGKLKKFGWDGDEILALHQRKGCPEYVKKLVDTFEKETGLSANDLHYRNIMQDGNTVIVTDPSSGCYFPLGYTPVEQAWCPLPDKQFLDAKSFELVG